MGSYTWKDLFPVDRYRKWQENRTGITNLDNYKPNHNGGSMKQSQTKKRNNNN